MKGIVTKVLLVVCILSLCLTGCSTGTNTEEAERSEGEYQEIELVMAVNGTDIQIDTRVADKFAELVAEETDGRVTISVFPNDQLAGGNASKGIEMIAGGGVDLAAYATSVLSVIDRQLSIGIIPWSFDSYEEARQIIDESGGAYYADRLEMKGLTYLGSFHNGFRQLTNSKHEVTTPEDMKGLKIRVPGTEAYMGVFRELGADPTSMSWSEVFTALQQKTIDGQENGISITSSSKMPEVQKYLTLWNYAYDSDLIIANTKVWESLEPKTQEMLEEKAREACEWGRDVLEAEEAELLEEFREDGMVVTELTDEELQAFKDAVADYRNELIDSYGEEDCAAFGIVKE